MTVCWKEHDWKTFDGGKYCFRCGFRLDDPKETDYCINVQCTDRVSGKLGSFIADTDHNAISPVFKDLSELYPWMRENGWKSEERAGESFTPWRVVRAAAVKAGK